MAGSKWELGVVAFHDSLEEYDQFAKLKTAYVSPTNQNTPTVTLALDDAIATDYTASPFYLWGDQNTLSGGIPGSTFWVGPSSDTSYDGTIELAAVSSITTNTVTLKVNQGYHSISVLDANYSVGDPVVIRTIPHGWTALSAPDSNDFGVAPIARHRDIAQTARIAGQNTSETINSEDAYKYFNQTGVRLMTDISTTNANRGIQIITPVNSISDRIRRYRSSWYYRVVAASASGGTAQLNARGEIIMKALDGQGVVLGSLTGETGTSTVSQSMNTYNSRVTDWTIDSHLISGFAGSDSDNTWDLKTGDNFSDNQMNRINRMAIQVKLNSGTNTAFDVDDIVIEHCHGTSKEANGFYEMDDYPTQGSLSWAIRKGPTSNRNTLANNTMRASMSHGNAKPKHVIQAQYNSVSRQIYDDLMVLEQWQSRGNLICLRPYHEALPNVMVGFLTLNGFNNEMPDLGRVSFGLQFEEA